MSDERELLEAYGPIPWFIWKATRDSVIEECARAIEQWENDDTPRSYLDLIAAIRALKDK